MSARKFYLLGTASQVPTRSRNHGGYFLRWDEEGMLFDPGEGTQRQMISAGVSVTEITKIFITHFHGDHCLGLAGIIQRLSLDGVPHQVNIYYPASGQMYYERLKQSSIFFDKSNIKECPISQKGVIFKNRKLEIETRQLDHSVDTWGYRITECDDFTMLPDKLKRVGVIGPDVGKLIKQGQININGKKIYIKDVSKPRLGQSFAFVLDTKVCDAAYKLAENVDLLVCESTYLSDRAKEAVKYGHLTATDAANIAKKSNAKNLVLTHFSQRYPAITLFLNEAKAIFPNVFVVRDSEYVDVPKRNRQI